MEKLKDEHGRLDSCVQRFTTTSNRCIDVLSPPLLECFISNCCCNNLALRFVRHIAFQKKVSDIDFSMHAHPGDCSGYGGFRPLSIHNVGFVLFIALYTI